MVDVDTADDARPGTRSTTRYRTGMLCLVYLLVCAVPVLVFIVLKLNPDHISTLDEGMRCPFVPHSKDGCDQATKYALPWYLWGNSRGFRILAAFAVLSAASTAGALGSVLSSMSGTKQWNGKDPIATLLAGSISAGMLTLVFAGGLVAGSLFPSMRDDWYSVIHLPSDFAKLLVWAFVAGFSQRAMPNMFRGLALRLELPDADKPSKVVATATEVAPKRDE